MYLATAISLPTQQIYPSLSSTAIYSPLYNNPAEAAKIMANHIRQMQEELEFAMLNLDSTNVSSLDLSQTVITTASGNPLTGENLVIDCGDWDEGG